MRRRRFALGAMAALAAATALAAPAPASDDPIRVNVTAPGVVALRQRVPITVAVAADKGAFDTRTARIRLRVRLAAECGATYASTAGTRVVDAALSPQPKTGASYSYRRRSRSALRRYGALTVCVFLEEEGDNRLFAFDDSAGVKATRRCTRAYRAHKRGAALRRACRS